MQMNRKFLKIILSKNAIIPFALFCTKSWPQNEEIISCKMIPKSEICYYDEKTKIIFATKENCTTLFATKNNNDTLWITNPLKDSKIQSYRFDKPKIVKIYKISKESASIHDLSIRDFIGICYNSTQFGAINKKTGKFIFWGQD